MSASPTLATAVAKFGLVASTAAAVGYNVWQMKSVLNQSFDEPNDFRCRYQEELQQQSAQSEAEVTSRVVAHARVKTPIYVIFGSESGTAEMLAMELLEALQTKAASQSWNTTITLVDPNSCDGQDSGVSTDRQVNRCMSMLTEAPSTAIFLFVVATTGDGESPHNFLPMDRALRKLMRKITSAAPTPLSHVKYSVFALGNSTYTHFCNGGVRVRESMKGCGAEELIPMARGDAVDGLQEVVFDAWRDLVLNCFESQATQLFCPSLGIPTTGTSEENESAEPDASTRRIPRGWFHKPVAMEVRAKVQVSQTREEDDSCVFRVTLQTPQLTSTEADFSTTYEAGDHFGVFAPNAPQLIERCLAVCGLSPAQGKQCCVEDGCTVTAWEILERYVDISGPPAYSMMVALAKRGTDDEEKKRLEEYAARHRSGTVAKRTSRDATSEGTLRTTADVLEAFPHCVSGLTVWELIQLLPRMQPRYYSIATDGHYSHPDSVDFFIRTEVGGLISHYVRDVLKEGDQLFAFWRPSKFHYFPAKVKLSPKRPVVMIGPGTGVAPLVGLCYRREALMRLSPSTAWGPLVLFFGARHRTLDYFVQTELERWALPATAMQEWDEKHHYPRESAAARCSRSFSPLSSPVISLLECAFSRDGGPDTASRFYVMDLIKKHGSYICSLLVNQGGLLYVCGDAMRMAPSVEGALIQEMVEHCKFTPLSARSFLRSMEATGLYQKDVYE